MHDQTAVKTEGIDELIHRYPEVKFLVDSGYRGLANDHPNQVMAPPLKPKKDAPPAQVAEVPVLLAGLGGHCHDGAEPGAQDFPVGLVTQQHH